jgi:hypothetical protein
LKSAHWNIGRGTNVKEIIGCYVGCWDGKGLVRGEFVRVSKCLEPGADRCMMYV